MRHQLPRTSGVYQIRCVSTGKVYNGSAVNIHLRWLRHQLHLRRGKHPNQHLQAAWERYGEENFEISVLEVVSRDALLEAEQVWLDKTKCTDRDFGFNIYPIAGSPGAIHARVWKGFVDPEGNEVTITNLFDFCREFELDFPSMHRLAQGKSKLKSYKGWTHEQSVRRRAYVKTYAGFIGPHGNAMGPITNLAAFCRKHGLEQSHMVAVAHSRLCSHRGWTYNDGKKRSETVYSGFISPAGEFVMITNLTAFCREHELHPVHMHQLRSGLRKSHKGWTWRALSDESAG